MQFLFFALVQWYFFKPRRVLADKFPLPQRAALRCRTHFFKDSGGKRDQLPFEDFLSHKHSLLLPKCDWVEWLQDIVSLVPEDPFKTHCTIPFGCRALLSYSLIGTAVIHSRKRSTTKDHAYITFLLFKWANCIPIVVRILGTLTQDLEGRPLVQELVPVLQTLNQALPVGSPCCCEALGQIGDRMMGHLPQPG